MAEEYRVYCQQIGNLRKKYSGLDTDEYAKHIFIDAFKMGRKLGFDAGYTKAIDDIESFEYDDDDSVVDDLIDDTYQIDNFDSIEEILDY